MESNQVQEENKQEQQQEGAGAKQYILVTGGLGYIGSHTVVELVVEEDELVVIVDNLDNTSILALDRLREITGKPENIFFHQIDIKDQAAMTEVFSTYTFKSVLHFAALKAVGDSVKKPLEYYNNNVSGTISLLQMMQKFNVKTFVFSSSACVYGENPVNTETDKIQPINPYG